MDKPRYYIEQDEDGSWYLANPWTGCPIIEHMDREKALRRCAEHNREKYEPEF